MIAIGV